MNKYLYDCFQQWGNSVWITSDPHFSDIESYELRGFPITKPDKNNKIFTVEALDEMQIKHINSKAGKNDTLIILGDVGNIECVKKLRAGRKILIMGNHDAGKSNYQRDVHDSFDADKLTLEDTLFLKEKVIPASMSDEEKKRVLEKYDDLVNRTIKVVDNRLFDEVYEGKLQINPRIVLSHEPLDDPYSFNIHGHDHGGKDFKKYVLKDYDADMPPEDYTLNYLKTIRKYNLNKFNAILEYNNYYPVNLNDIIKSGVLANVKDIHRVTIDNAIEKSNKKTKKDC